VRVGDQPAARDNRASRVKDRPQGSIPERENCFNFPKHYPTISFSTLSQCGNNASQN
jgi:hypothetical protein